MKGIIIYENDLRVINAVKLKNASFCYETVKDNNTDTLQGTPVTCASTTCNKEDIYDFETGALIALMKMCGVEKSAKAYAEIFDDTAYGDALIERDNLKEQVKNLWGYNNGLIKKIEQKNRENISLKKEKEQIIVAKNVLYNKLEEENKNLKKRINELENYNNQLEERVAAEQRGGYAFLKDMEKLQHEYDLCRNSENALKFTTQMQNKSIEKLTKAIDGYKQDLYKVSKRCEELELKEDILNKQQEQLDKREEKISVYFGGRGCGKQHKALIELFKKIDKKKVQEAYKEAYGDKVIWCTSDEWLYKPPTKREEMWENIKNGKIDSVKVEKAFINDFLSEAEEHGLVWAHGGEKPTEWVKWEAWSRHDHIVFTIYDNSKYKELTWSINSEVNTVDYLPPMRWDLFEKGRKIVRVTPENIDEFIIHIMTPEDLVRNQHENPKKYSDKKIVNWEDVR